MISLLKVFSKKKKKHRKNKGGISDSQYAEDIIKGHLLKVLRDDGTGKG